MLAPPQRHAVVELSDLSGDAAETGAMVGELGVAHGGGLLLRVLGKAELAFAVVVGCPAVRVPGGRVGAAVEQQLDESAVGALPPPADPPGATG